MEKSVKKGDTSMFWIVLIVVLLLIGLPFIISYKSDEKKNEVTTPITVNGDMISDYDESDQADSVDNINPNESVSDVFDGLWTAEP